MFVFCSLFCSPFSFFLLFFSVLVLFSLLAHSFIFWYPLLFPFVFQICYPFSLFLLLCFFCLSILFYFYSICFSCFLPSPLYVLISILLFLSSFFIVYSLFNILILFYYHYFLSFFFVVVVNFYYSCPLISGIILFYVLFLLFDTLVQVILCLPFHCILFFHIFLFSWIVLFQFLHMQSNFLNVVFESWSHVS